MRHFLHKRDRYEIAHLSGRGWVILDPRGRRVSEGVADRSEAQAGRDALQVEADRAKKRGPRACLCCGARFVSAGIHNRLCDLCRQRDAEEVGQRPQVPARRASV